jgi:putative chitobiose transport system substrate-binding protein
MLKYAKLLFIILITVIVFCLSKPQKDSEEVVFWSLQMGTFENYMNPLIKKFEAENPDIKIKWIDVPYSEGEKRTLASILSNTPPDLVNLTPEFSDVLAQKQALEFIDCGKLKDYNKQITDMLKHDGKCYAVPFYATSSLTVYNREIFDKAGIKEIPKTYDDLNAIAASVKTKTNAYATMPTLTENDTLLKILNKYNINTPETLASGERIFNDYKTLYQNDLIPKESITQTHREALEKYMSGQLALIQSGANFLNIIKENAPKIYKETEAAHQLTGNTGKYDVSVMNLIIPARARHKDGALRFALFLTNKENQVELAKLTTILPVNNEALNDKFFTEYDNHDVISKARYLSAKQLGNLQPPVRIKYNRKEVLNTLNTSVQQIMLNKIQTNKSLEQTAGLWKKLETK